MNAYWKQAAGALRRAILGACERQILGRTYRVVPQARGTKEDRDWPLLQVLARGRRCIWDVGANLGLTSLLMADAMVDGGKLVAFEASEAAALGLGETVRLNALGHRIEVLNVLVGDRVAAVPFYWQEASGGASIQVDYLGDDRIRLVKSAVRLDDLAEGLPVPEFIKIDVEGAENLVVRGARHLLRQHRPWLLIELHALGDGDLLDQAASILEATRDLEYRMIYLRTGETVERETLEVLKGRGRTHVLLVHQTQDPFDVLAGLDMSSI